MKKIFIILAITFIVVNVNAQWFLGGEIGLNVQNEKANIALENFDPTTLEIGFSIAPKMGYYFNEKFALGLSLSIGANFIINEPKKDFKYQMYSVNWGAFPFVRYSVFTYKKFFLALEGRTGVGGSHSFYKFGDNKTEKGFTTIAIGVFNITPILGFNFTEHLQIEAGLHFLNIGYNVEILKGKGYYFYPGTGEVEIMNHEINKIRHDFNIGFNSSSILVMTQLRFGVVYKF